MDDETEKKYSFLRPSYLFRFEFTFESLKWGVVVGALLASHSYNRYGDMRRASQLGLIGASVSTSAFFLFRFYRFTM
jgi:hypothetical protein